MSRDSMAFRRCGGGLVPTARFAEAFDERYACPSASACQGACIPQHAEVA